MEVDLIDMKINWQVHDKKTTVRLGSKFKKEDLFLYCVIYGAGDRVELLEAVFL